MKNIVLCADGTGNKGGYGNDTNVYKVYKAVDIHHNGIQQIGIQQITFYDQGVGTEKSDTNKNKYLTALSAAFGFGFQHNVRDLYKSLVRSYNIGDSIFLFGFSRGAATVRALTGFIHHCGLIDRNHPKLQTNGVFDDEKFKQLVDEAIKCYQVKGKKADDFKEKYAIKDNEYAPGGNLKIKFIGVWDTVSALGFPKDFSMAFELFFKLVDKLSDYIWPHNFYDYDLNPSIENAYHAISIDDERKTFHPMIWNESKTNGHVEQVWFAGVHSNVGGGYPRTGLSDIALEWIITKAQAHGLIFYQSHKDQISGSANKNDRLYNSRDGVAIYYRYSPRDLESLCEGKLKDNNKIAIHKSAYEKIKDVCDPYAPNGLPISFDVVGVNPNYPFKPTTLHTPSVDQGNIEQWDALKAEENKYIKSREILYRLFVELTLLIFIVAGYFWIWDIPESLKHNETLPETPYLVKLADFLNYITPVYFENFITVVVCNYPIIFFSMLAILFIMSSLSKFFTKKLRDVCRKLCNLVPILSIEKKS
ncbi:DUF2235 domain-containing protein [Nitrosomonas sp. Is37]|uniref:DUF2235 domain-containing protein n=1 Tax=Nitrosomonas sp. Is37 TaxID=3080535 RepID=UPI00294B1FE9|nr:DUF2235 domain-containing protein [Nitrosomonas sp. Is37]MDV6345722.1 DUF2235 domain-containing protein [Nitrosomonas sp. Is37]